MVFIWCNRLNCATVSKSGVSGNKNVRQITRVIRTDTKRYGRILWYPLVLFGICDCIGLNFWYPFVSLLLFAIHFGFVPLQILPFTVNFTWFTLTPGAKCGIITDNDEGMAPIIKNGHRTTEKGLSYKGEDTHDKKHYCNGRKRQSDRHHLP